MRARAEDTPLGGGRPCVICEARCKCANLQPMHDDDDFCACDRNSWGLRSELHLGSQVGALRSQLVVTLRRVAGTWPLMAATRQPCDRPQGILLAIGRAHESHAITLAIRASFRGSHAVVLAIG